MMTTTTNNNNYDNNHLLQQPQQQPQQKKSKSNNKKMKLIVTSSFLIIILFLVVFELDFIEFISWTNHRTSKSSTTTTKRNKDDDNGGGVGFGGSSVVKGDDSQLQQSLSSSSSSSSRLQAEGYVYNRRGRSLTSMEQNDLSNTWGTWTCSKRQRPNTNNHNNNYDFYSNYPNRDVPIHEFTTKLKLKLQSSQSSSSSSSSSSPSQSWQQNYTYVTEFLNQSIQLINRTIESILIEYGKGMKQQLLVPTTTRTTNETKKEDDDFNTINSNIQEWNTKSRWSMFGIDRFYNFTTSTSPKIYDKSQGGWTTYNSWQNGLQRRLLHSIMTEDSFIIGIGGHSATAGHGNHFQQSYGLQIQRILQPLFARLGVYFESRNIANGGLGTLQSSLSSSSIYGPDIDFLIWDSGMTEQSINHVDVFALQGILLPTQTQQEQPQEQDDDVSSSSSSSSLSFFSKKVPILWNLQPWSILTNLHDTAYVDVGGMFSGSRGVGRATTRDDINQMPYALRYMKCVPTLENDICKSRQYNGTCWIQPPSTTSSTKNNHTNIPTILPTPQREYPGGRAKWHPGFRQHQLTGRILTMTILQALRDALLTWQEHHHQNNAELLKKKKTRNPATTTTTTTNGENMDDSSSSSSSSSFLLPAHYWHVTEHYQRIQKALKETGNKSPCFELADKIPARVCQISLRGRSEYTPRAYPSRTSIRTLMPPEMLRYINSPEPNLYQPPDLYNPILDPPPNDSKAINVLNIVEGGTEFEPLLYSRPEAVDAVGGTNGVLHYYDQDNIVASSTPLLSNPYNMLEPGRGIFLNTVAGADDSCDGSYTSFCNRGATNDCLLGGMNDYRGGLHFDCLSGWLIFNVPRVIHGIILIKLETYHEASPLTKGWRTINNVTTTTTNSGKGKDSPKTGSNRRISHHRGQDRYLQQKNKKNKKGKSGPPESDSWCDDFTFEYALNGNVTKWNKVEFFDHHLQKIQRLVSLVTLLDNEDEENYNNPKNGPPTIQVALRITGCDRNQNYNQGFQLTHVYWA